MKRTFAVICFALTTSLFTSAPPAIAKQNSDRHLPQSVICQGSPRDPTATRSSALPGHTRSTSEYSITDKKKIYIASKGSRIYGDRGVTLSISKGISHTISGEVTGTVSVEAGVLFAQASASLAVSVGGSVTTSSSHSGTWTVTTKVGWLEVGTKNGYSFKWTKFHYRAPCTKVIEGKGTGKAVAKNAAVYYKHS